MRYFATLFLLLFCNVFVVGVLDSELEALAGSYNQNYDSMPEELRGAIRNDVVNLHIGDETVFLKSVDGKIIDYGVGENDDASADFYLSNETFGRLLNGEVGFSQAVARGEISIVGRGVFSSIKWEAIEKGARTFVSGKEAGAYNAGLGDNYTRGENINYGVNMQGVNNRTLRPIKKGLVVGILLFTAVLVGIGVGVRAYGRRGKRKKIDEEKRKREEKVNGLVDYISKWNFRGYNLGFIKNALIGFGYERELVDEAFLRLNGAKS